MKKAIIVLALAVVCGLGCATAQKGAILRAQSGMEKGKYEFALRRLSEAEKYAEPKPMVKAEIVFLKGVCYTELKKPVDARAMFQYVADNFPETMYGYQAKARLAEEQKK